MDNNLFGLSLWKSIMQTCQSVLNCSKWVVGKCDKTRFWQDVWCGSENFQSHFPLIFTIVRDKSMLIENAYGVGTPSSWEVVVNRNLHDWRLVEYENLLQLLAGIRLSSVDDRSSWNLCKNSVFFVKSFYRSLVDSPVSCSGFTHKIFWHSLVRT